MALCKIKLNHNETQGVIEQLTLLVTVYRTAFFATLATLVIITGLFCCLSVYKTESQIKDNECLFYARQGEYVQECQQ